MFTTIKNQLIQSNTDLINMFNIEQTVTQSKHYPFQFIEELYSHEIDNEIIEAILKQK